ncbi:TetR/AcrR family transcriptional regulator [Mycobacterium sp.]|uniref:TetR/AcrR family transcriptional regulator n=1 Tax=Mycobacterium sp. TaxID=1785 RepID=UPI002C0ED5BD|nr:TetR/AcrR family transcriptional regulator [Mycobacterium sp.]HTY34899.1 TetR/AcrR family transcriptional regulator [Mycobacterium sp.]
MSSALSQRRNKLAPDPDVRYAIVAAASKSMHEHGVQGLSVATVLERAQLSTRAFYRHFDSKDQLVTEVFLELARLETQRLREKMADTANPVDAVVAWVDGRLELAFGEVAEDDLRCLSSLDAYTKAVTSPEMVAPAYGAILEPLIEQIERGLELGVFQDIVPSTAAKSIHGVVWAGTQRQWAAQHWDRTVVRERVLRFCLRGLGVSPHTIEQVTGSAD